MALKAASSKSATRMRTRRGESVAHADRACIAGASGDYNPLHADEVYTTQVAGYPSVFAHGMLTMGLTGKMLTNYVGDGRLTKFGVRFTNQVWPGDTWTRRRRWRRSARKAGQHFVDLTLSTTNQDGKEVVQGSATARIDP